MKAFLKLRQKMTQDVQEARMISPVHGDSSTEKCPGSGVPPPQAPTGGGVSVDGGSRNGEPGSRANDTLLFPRAFDPYGVFASRVG